LIGFEVVIDKDIAMVVIVSELSVDLFIIFIGVDGVVINFNIF